MESQNDVDKLYALLERFEKSGLETKLIEETPKQEMDVVYIDRAHIDNCFDNENCQIAPISLFIHTNELDRFTECLTTQPYFTFELCQASEELNNYHYQLHPISEPDCLSHAV
nr:DUF2913 family protein [Vibrio splendidus]